MSRRYCGARCSSSASRSWPLRSQSQRRAKAYEASTARSRTQAAHTGTTSTATLAGHLPASSDNVKLRLEAQTEERRAGQDRRRRRLERPRLPRRLGRRRVQVQRRPRRRHQRTSTAPKEVAFIQAKEGSAPGEGIQALRSTRPSFTGDVLVSNNEKCKDKTGFGGLNIYDVSRPVEPDRRSPRDSGTRPSTGQGKKAANDIHSIFAWDAGSQGVRRHRRQRGRPGRRHRRHLEPQEAVRGRRVRPRREVSADRRRRSGESRRDLPSRHGREGDRRSLLHARLVLGRRLRRRSTSPIPKNATYVADSDFATIDPQLARAGGSLRGARGQRPRGRVHDDNRYIVAADEDFSATGLRGTTNDGRLVPRVDG